DVIVAGNGDLGRRTRHDRTGHRGAVSHQDSRMRPVCRGRLVLGRAGRKKEKGQNDQDYRAEFPHVRSIPHASRTDLSRSLETNRTAGTQRGQTLSNAVLSGRVWRRTAPGTHAGRLQPRRTERRQGKTPEGEFRRPVALHWEPCADSFGSFWRLPVLAARRLS